MKEALLYMHAGTKRSTELDLRYVAKYDEHLPSPANLLNVDDTHKCRQPSLRRVQHRHGFHVSYVHWQEARP